MDICNVLQRGVRPTGVLLGIRTPPVRQRRKQFCQFFWRDKTSCAIPHTIPRARIPLHRSFSIRLCMDLFRLNLVSLAVIRRYAFGSSLKYIEYNIRSHRGSNLDFKLVRSLGRGQGAGTGGLSYGSKACGGIEAHESHEGHEGRPKGEAGGSRQEETR